MTSARILLNTVVVHLYRLGSHIIDLLSEQIGR